MVVDKMGVGKMGINQLGSRRSENKLLLKSILMNTCVMHVFRYKKLEKLQYSKFIDSNKCTVLPVGKISLVKYTFIGLSQCQSFCTVFF